MHELLKQLPSEERPRKRGAIILHAAALAKDHYSMLSEEQRNCVVCSSAAATRKRTRYVCAACQVHLCIGECFSCYHA